MFQSAGTFGGTEAMFFAKDSKRVPLSGAQLNEVRAAKPLDTDYELAIFRSATWPYYGYPQGFVASQEGFYKVRFSARAVLQTPEFELIPAKASIPMTFRARNVRGPTYRATSEQQVEPWTSNRRLGSSKQQYS